MPQDTVKNLTVRLTKRQDPYDNGYIIRKRMFRDRQREQRSAGSPRKGNWTMAVLGMNGGETKGEKAMEFTGKQIQEARERIAPFVDETPLLRLKGLDAYLGCQVYVKAECMQKTGAFKFRGAMNRILTLTEEELSRGIVAASSGNHGRAIAYGARMKGARAVIVMPQTAPEAKKKAIMELGAEVVLCEAPERFEVAERICMEGGSTMIPPYDDYDVMAGQGTLGLELMEQCPELSAVIVPASGGGLIGGVSAAVKSVSDHTKVYGAEPSALPRYTESLKAGEPVLVPMKKSLADALVSQRPGLKNFPVVKAYVDGFASVDDPFMLKGMKLLLMEGKVLAEPSACIGIGAVLEGRIPVGKEDKVCFVISGGNLGFEQLEFLKDI